MVPYFYTIFQGPSFLKMSLVCLPFGSFSFLRLAHTKSPTSNSKCILFWSICFLYFLEVCWSCALTSSWIYLTIVENYSHHALTFSCELMFLNSNIPLGWIIYTTWNGEFPILLLLESLYANSAWGMIAFHFSPCFLVSDLNKFPNVLLTSFVSQSIWGW